MPISLAIVLVGLQLAQRANGFLEDCPIDRDLRVDNDQVIAVLENFYNDLKYVRAVTESRHERDYSSQLGELPAIVSSGAQQRQIEQMVQMLSSGNFEEAYRRSNTIFWDIRDSLPVRSYLHYFKAEAQRLMGYASTASAQVLDAINVRQRSTGVSVNELERLDGLVTLQRVSQFNQEVDSSYGLRTSPNMRLLSLIHSVLRDDMSPLLRVRAVTLSRFLESSTMPAHAWPAMSDGLHRVDPERDNFRGQTVPERSAEAVLCEFAQKLSTLGAASYGGAPPDYSHLVEQVAHLDAAFAHRFVDQVVRPVENNEGRLAMRNVVGFWTMLNAAGPAAAPSRRTPAGSAPHSSRYEHGKALETYAKYFRVEIYRRQADRCMYLKVIEMLLDRIKDARQARTGVSLDKILELEAKVVFMSLDCFRRRVRSAYQLDGGESEQQLRTRWADMGPSDRIFPPTDLPF